MPLRYSFYTPQGNRKDVFFVLWKGFAVDAGTWEPLASMNEATVAEDIAPLLAQLQQAGTAELQQHHDCTIMQLQRAMVQALKKREGNNVLDRAAQALVRIETLTFARLFGDRLDLTARAYRSGRPACRTFAFVTTQMFYEKVFPKTRLQRLAHSVGVGARQQRRILAVSAHVREGVHAGETVYVLTTKKSYLRRQNRVVSTQPEHLELRIACSVRYSKNGNRKNLTIRGAVLSLRAKEWAQVHRYLPPW